MNRLILLGILALVVVLMWVMSFASKRMEHVAAGIAALPEASFELPTLVTLGTGGTFENPWRLGPAVAVASGSELLLFDAGRGVAEALRRAEIPAWQPTHVFLTSLLPENTVGLDDLLTTGWHGPREAPLVVHGPKGTRELVERLASAHAEGLAALAADWELPEAGGRIEAVELGTGQRIQHGAFEIEATLLEGNALPSLAYRVEAGDRSVVISGAGAAPGLEALVALATGADALVSQAVYGASLEAAAEAGVDGLEVIQREAAQHLRLEDIGDLGTRTGVKLLVLTRMRPPPVFEFQYRRLVNETFRGRVEIAPDGGVFEF
ncbi:MAG: hypothetical protein QNK05_03160 [Myxococcota bacterium]|nr:hypothetical protein [Myxococcota bacterium]